MRMKRAGIWSVATGILMALVLAVGGRAAHAQVNTGGLRGSVVGEDGLPMELAEVTLVHEPTKNTKTAYSTLIDSLELLSGSRSSIDSIRTGEDRMSAEAIVEAPGSIGPGEENNNCNESARPGIRFSAESSSSTRRTSAGEVTDRLGQPALVVHRLDGIDQR